MSTSTVVSVRMFNYIGRFAHFLPIHNPHISSLILLSYFFLSANPVPHPPLICLPSSHPFQYCHPSNFTRWPPTMTTTFP